jgi:hypothetical protein
MHFSEIHSPLRSTTRVFFVITLCLFLGSAATDTTRKKEYVIIESADIPRSEKEALLIVPGFGARAEGVGDIAGYFGHKGYDVFIPSYISRDSLNECVTNLDQFIKDNKLGEYKKVHVFSYIIGSWTINRWIRKNPENNIATIVYDRSALQERAPYAITKDIPFFVRLLEGRIVAEFATIPYEPIVNDSTNIGLILESRATRLMRKHRKTAMELGPLDWSAAGRNQDCDDYLYTLNNHDEMYHDFEYVGKEIFAFIRTGRFTAEAKRVMPATDPFTKKRPAE